MEFRFFQIKDNSFWQNGDYYHLIILLGTVYQVSDMTHGPLFLLESLYNERKENKIQWNEVWSLFTLSVCNSVDRGPPLVRLEQIFILLPDLHSFRQILDSKYGLKRWQIGEIASKIGQLYYHY